VKNLYRCLFIVLVVLSGCGPSVRPLHKGREVPVEGTVTIAGFPVKAGSIRFVELGPVFTQSGGDISDGAFRFGVVPGTKRVEISVLGPEGRAVARYASDTSDLRAEVADRQENQFSFELTSK
jgi:hypothetical protein